MPAVEHDAVAAHPLPHRTSEYAPRGSHKRTIGNQALRASPPAPPDPACARRTARCTTPPGCSARTNHSSPPPPPPRPSPPCPAEKGNLDQAAPHKQLSGRQSNGLAYTC